MNTEIITTVMFRVVLVGLGSVRTLKEFRGYEEEKAKLFLSRIEEANGLDMPVLQRIELKELRRK